MANDGTKQRLKPEELEPEPGGEAGFFMPQRSFLRVPGLSREAKLVGMVFASYAGADRIAFPGVPLLKKETGMGDSLVKRGRRELVEKGFLEHAQDHDEAGHFDVVRYKVTSKLLHRPPEVTFHTHGSKPHEQRAATAGCSTAQRCSRTPVNQPRLRTKRQSESMSVLNKSKTKSESLPSERPSRTDSDADKFKGPRSEGKTLSEVLEIDVSRIGNKEQRGMRDLQRAFEHEQPPLDPEGLAGWLDGRLKWMKAQGHVYPKIVLRRLKDLQRSRSKAAAREAPEAAQNFQGSETGELGKLKELRRIMRPAIWALWEKWTRPARAGTHAERCRAFLRAAESKGVELTPEERGELERGAAGAPQKGDE